MAWNEKQRDRDNDSSYVTYSVVEEEGERRKDCMCVVMLANDMEWEKKG